MKGFENPVFLIGWIISNLVALLMLWAAWKKPNLTRAMFALLFAWASWTNCTTVHSTPEVYLEYASLSISWYSDFILGWFSDHITPMVTAIAAIQAFLAVGMVLRNWWVKISCIGIISFLLAIAPLGVGSGFPFSLTASAAAWLIFRNNELDFLWKSEKTNHHSRFKRGIFHDYKIAEQ